MTNAPMCCHPTDFSLPLSLSGLHAWTRLEMELGIDTSKILRPVEPISPTGAEVIHSGSSEEWSYDEKTEGVDHSEEKQRSIEITFVV